MWIIKWSFLGRVVSLYLSLEVVRTFSDGFCFVGQESCASPPERRN
jgi:hypothetical protein